MENVVRRNVVLDKSFSFSIKVIKLYSSLKEQKEYDLARQFLKSGTSIGANIEEAQGAQSKKDFVAKMSIAYKEARESQYWIRLFREAQVIEHELMNVLYDDVDELCKLLSSILIKSKS